jgi:hypothetical protein
LNVAPHRDKNESSPCGILSTLSGACALPAFGPRVPAALLRAPEPVAGALGLDLATAIRLLWAALQWSLESSMTGLENVSAENFDSSVNITRCEQRLVVLIERVSRFL